MHKAMIIFDGPVPVVCSGSNSVYCSGCLLLSAAVKQILVNMDSVFGFQFSFFVCRVSPPPDRRLSCRFTFLEFVCVCVSPEYMYTLSSGMIGGVSERDRERERV